VGHSTAAGADSSRPRGLAYPPPEGSASAAAMSALASVDSGRGRSWLPTMGRCVVVCVEQDLLACKSSLAAGMSGMSALAAGTSGIGTSDEWRAETWLPIMGRCVVFCGVRGLGVCMSSLAPGKIYGFLGPLGRE